jgi:hypothetical protein
MAQRLRQRRPGWQLAVLAVLLAQLAIGLWLSLSG